MAIEITKIYDKWFSSLDSKDIDFEFRLRWNYEGRHEQYNELSKRNIFLKEDGEEEIPYSIKIF